MLLETGGPISQRNRSAQNPANRGAADLQPSGDFGFADASAAQLPDFRSACGRSCRTTQPLAVFPRMSQASLGPFPQNLSFELGEYCEQAGHGATGWSRQIQRLRQGNEADAEVFQFLERLPAVSPALPASPPRS
jgi:hypothetical protein